MVTKSPCTLGFKSELSTKVKVSPLHSTGKIKENDKIEGYCIFLLIRHVFPYKKVCFSRLQKIPSSQIKGKFDSFDVELFDNFSFCLRPGREESGLIV